MGISQSHKIENLCQVMSTLKHKTNVNLPHLLCIVVSAAQNGKLVGGWKAHFRLLQRFSPRN